MGQPEVVGRVCAFIRANPDAPPTLRELGRHVGFSPAYLQRVFKKALGISPRQYADACRLERLKTGLREGDTVTTAMIGAGYGSPSRLYEKADGQLGMTPGTYRKGGAAVAVRYATAACPLGCVLLAATDRGVCAVSLGDTDDELEGFLKAEFPNATLTRDADSLAGWLAELVRHVSGHQPDLDLPLDVRATAFQRRVWEELRKIPYGETRTYREVAESLGDTKSTRAVARACATNPACLVVPCHRVVGSDGGLRGYRWGVARKQKLLENERPGSGM